MWVSISECDQVGTALTGSQPSLDIPFFFPCKYSSGSQPSLDFFIIGEFRMNIINIIFLITHRLIDQARNNKFDRTECIHNKSTTTNVPTSTYKSQIFNYHRRLTP